MTLFGMKVLINNFLTLHWHCFDIKRVKCIPGNKTSTKSRHEWSFMLKNRKNGIIFNFSDFDKDLPLFKFYQSTIDTIINMAVYLRTCILKPYKKTAKFVIFTPLKWFENNKILNLPL